MGLQATSGSGQQRSFPYDCLREADCGQLKDIVWSR